MTSQVSDPLVLKLLSQSNLLWIQHLGSPGSSNFSFFCVWVLLYHLFLKDVSLP